MPATRYKPARTLVRRLCRRPGEQKAEFRCKIARLREHFERFNIDVSDICQWLMSLRPKDVDGVSLFWSFFLEPTLNGIEADESERDRWRMTVFDELAGIRQGAELAGHPLPRDLQNAMDNVTARPKKQTAERLFARLRTLNPAHRLVLLKAAAEWIVARYDRGMQNWKRQHEEWEKEKREWEARHPQLTEDVRASFTNVFRNLIEPDGDGSSGIRRKNPRICGHERLKQNSDNCVYAGEKGHGPLCWKFAKFVSDRKKETNGKFKENFFAENAAVYLHERQKLDQLGRRFTGSKRETALEKLYQAKPPSQKWFRNAWDAYLKAMELNEQTVIAQGCLPHCQKIGPTWEKSECEWNPHTHLCQQYQNALASLDSETLKLEAEYREWRRNYLAGPRKPSFRYPSSRKLPMPKIFGAGFHQIDFDNSVLRLRLDDMREGEWIEFGFIPWPKHYRPSRKEVEVTSLHVNFIGARGRVGFRFDVPQRPSKFQCSQDEIDELRSRQFPRQAQDQQFLEAARKRLLESLADKPQSELRILAVDLGETGAQAAVFVGRSHRQDVPLPIVKIDQCYSAIPDVLETDKQRQPPPKFERSQDARGLRKEHVGRHLDQVKKSATRIAQHRQGNENQSATLRDSDNCSLTRHIRWMLRDWARHNAAQIVAAARQHQCDLIVFESLRGFRPRGYDEMDADQKRRLAFFAYGRIRRKVAEKAVEEGMRVVTVPYGYSSQICSQCAHLQLDKGRLRKNKNKRRFECACGGSGHKKKSNNSGPTATAESCSCQFKLDSDANAARVLARVFWGEIALSAREESKR